MSVTNHRVWTAATIDFLRSNSTILHVKTEDFWVVERRDRIAADINRNRIISRGNLRNVLRWKFKLRE